VIFNRHSELEGQHAFLGASSYHWINYDTEKISSRYRNFLATLNGTKDHELAAMLIERGVKLPRSRKTLNMFVNDAIGYQMTPEQPLYFSPNSFGTADAICFNDRLLRIHDLKTGVSPTSENQLEVYAALFCLEYGIKPEDIGIENRIYQLDDVAIFVPPPERINYIMNKIVAFDKVINEIKMEG
jgi:hypothetical protein